MQGKLLYEYAVIRLVPRVEREEFLNVGVVLYVASKKFLQMKSGLDEARIRALCEDLDINQVRDYLSAYGRVCKGGKDAGPIGELSIGQRFRWLAATRSTVVQMSKVHSGFCADPAEKLSQLYDQLVL